MRIIKYICMKFTVSIDIEIIMSIDTVTLVHVDMKKRNLHEGYCVYRHKDYYVYTHNISQPERDTACGVGRRRGMGDNTDKGLCVGRGTGCPLSAMHWLLAHHQHILLTKEHTETHPKEWIRNRPINLVLCSASGKELARDIPDASK